MKLWQVSGFDDGPQHETALVWADDPDDARGRLREWLGGHPDAVTSLRSSGWTVLEVEVIPQGGVWSVGTPHYVVSASGIERSEGGGAGEHRRRP